MPAPPPARKRLRGRHVDTQDGARSNRDRWIGSVGGILAVTVAGGTIVADVRAGDSGAQATWDGKVSTQRSPAGDDG